MLALDVQRRVRVVALRMSRKPMLLLLLPLLSLQAPKNKQTVRSLLQLLRLWALKKRQRKRAFLWTMPRIRLGALVGLSLWGPKGWMQALLRTMPHMLLGMLLGLSLWGLKIWMRAFFQRLAREALLWILLVPTLHCQKKQTMAMLETNGRAPMLEAELILVVLTAMAVTAGPTAAVTT